jgi:hypothetical protein
MLPGGALLGQSLIGTWQGPLQVSQTPETLCASCSKSQLPLRAPSAATCTTSIRAVHAAAPDVTLKGSAVKIAMPSFGGTYVGKLSGAPGYLHGNPTGVGVAAGSR